MTIKPFCNLSLLAIVSLLGLQSLEARAGSSPYCCFLMVDGQKLENRGVGMATEVCRPTQARALEASDRLHAACREMNSSPFGRECSVECNFER